jgi:hypothetical protein
VFEVGVRGETSGVGGCVLPARPQDEAATIASPPLLNDGGRNAPARRVGRVLHDGRVAVGHQLAAIIRRKSRSARRPRSARRSNKAQQLVQARAGEGRGWRALRAQPPVRLGRRPRPSRHSRRPRTDAGTAGLLLIFS